MKQIQNNLRRRFPPDRRYLVGVSGGRDSIALLHFLVESGYKKLTVCHLNHQLRGRASNRDAQFVKKICEQLDVDPEIESANVRALATRQKISIEAAGREARYKFFATTAKRKRTQTIFLGHHADDLVETFFINLFRGAGTAGLVAMREISKRRVGGVELTIVRPFLSLWRIELDQYVRKHRLKFCEDESNKDLAALRNRVRRRIIPYLEKALDRNIRENVWRAAMIAAEEETWIENQMIDGAGPQLAVADLRKMPVAVQRRQILKWLRARKISDVGFNLVEDVRSLLDHDARVAKVNLPRDRHARRRAGKIFIE